MQARQSALLALAVCLLAAGCGADRPATLVGAQPYSAKDPRSSFTGQATAAAFRRPIAEYRRHVERQLAAMSGDVSRMRAFAASDDLAGARRAWYDADARYESIGAAYGAFGALDQAINGTPAGLPDGVRSKNWTGLQKIEYELWERRSASSAAAGSARLMSDVARLRRRAAKLKIDPFEYSLRAHEVLEGSLNLQLAGRANQWSGSAVNALAANVQGTRIVLATLTPMLRQRGPNQLQQAELAVDRLGRTLRGTPVGARWQQLPITQRERISGYTAAAAEALAYVPELLDPRAPRPSQNPLGSAS